LSEISPHLKFLYSLQTFGVKLGLHNIRVLVRELGHPEQKYPTIHIAGTNGKGSTAAMLSSVLTASGYKTGLYTSPHLVSFNERIRVNGKKISDRVVEEYTKMLKLPILKTRATFFEATTAMAFQYFADQKVDIAVIEAGLGGRYDATNIIHPQVSIITSIALEHTEHLGTTIEQIAYQKGGIVKPQVPCFTAVEDNGALKVLKEIAKEKKSFLIHCHRKIDIDLKENGLEGIIVTAKTPDTFYNELVVSLCGQHQSKNLSIVLLALDYLKKKVGFENIIHHTIRQGLRNIKKYSGLWGRMDILQQHPMVIADAAHNPDGIRTLVNSLNSLVLGKVLLIFGVMDDKDYKTMIHFLKPIVRIAITASPKIKRALPANELSSEFHNEGISSLASRNVKEAYMLARQEVRRNEPILITGSQYLLGELMQQLYIVP
jgi:dihydrofolate synthase/folylpolyglutamate synthase